MNTEQVENTHIKAEKRSLVKVLSGIATTDGDGVKLTRIIGSPELNMLDPFLLLDSFESEQAQDYIGGFPEHPHRGFETVTYLLNGRMRHKDNAGHEGVIEPGGVQWMTAGKGILHSEMPEQENGLLQGFQLWVNLPKMAKMTEPNYQEFLPDVMPIERHINGCEITVIAGKTNQGTVGPVINDYTYPLYMDIRLPAGDHFVQNITVGHNAFIYLIQGDLTVEGETPLQDEKIVAKNLGVLSKGQQLSIVNGDKPSRLLLIAGKPLNEPVARGGPFVMNTRAEIMQAYDDFNNGLFHKASL